MAPSSPPPRRPLPDRLRVPRGPSVALLQIPSRRPPEVIVQPMARIHKLPKLPLSEVVSCHSLSNPRPGPARRSKTGPIMHLHPLPHHPSSDPLGGTSHSQSSLVHRRPRRASLRLNSSRRLHASESVEIFYQLSSTLTRQNTLQETLSTSLDVYDKPGLVPSRSLQSIPQS